MKPERMRRLITALLLMLANVLAIAVLYSQVSRKTEPSRNPLTVSDAKFEEILDGLLKASARHEVSQKYPDYSACADLGRKLDQAATPARAESLITAVKPLGDKSLAKVYILGALAKVGDPTEVTPIFLNELTSTATPGYEMRLSSTYVARDFVMHCKDPRAVDYLFDQLTGPHPDRVIKEEAYTHVAGTGGLRAAKIVMGMQRSLVPLPPLSDRVLNGLIDAGEFGGRTKVVAENQIAGRNWGLLESGALGNVHDLWLAEKVGGKWTNPQFMGVFNGPVSSWAKGAPTPKIEGHTGPDLLRANWAKLLVGNPKLSASSDASGLTNLEKQRLALSIGKTDSDGDGVADAVDPWPNVPKRPLDDDEQILAAAFEARFHFDSNVGPMILQAPAGMKPFEMPGRLGPTLWLSEANPKQFQALDACYEAGVGYIRFESPDQDKKKTWRQQLIHWNEDRSEAQVDIGLQYGGENGTGNRLTLRKYLGHWVVTDMTETWVS